MKPLRILLSFIAMTAMCTSVQADLVLRVVDPSGSNTITGLPGETVTGVVEITDTGAGAQITDLTAVAIGLTSNVPATPLAAQFFAATAEPTFWVPPDATGFTSGSILGAGNTTLKFTANHLQVSAGPPAVFSNAIPIPQGGTWAPVFQFDITIPAGASTGDSWELDFAADGLDRNFQLESVVGAMPFDGANLSGTLTAVPEPSSFIFLGLCGSAVGAISCWRKRQTVSAIAGEEAS